MDVVVTDVLLRDGLQDEPVLVETQDKVRLARLLADAGVAAQEVASFVNPRLVPQMADADAVVRQTADVSSRRIALALNPRGINRASAAGVDAIQVAVSASNAHSVANAGRSSENALAALGDAVRASTGTAFIAGISTAFVCPFDGLVPLGRLLQVVADVADWGVERISLADTLGVATSDQVVEAVRQVRIEHPNLEVGLHLHNAHGQALATAEQAIDHGVRHFDSALGGYGGCPFAPGASGNLSTEGLVARLDTLGISTGVDLEALAEARAFLTTALARGVHLAASESERM